MSPRYLLTGVMLVLALLKSGCVKTQKMTHKTVSTVESVTTTQDAAGADVASIRANSRYSQLVQASSNSAVAGTSLIFPPGSLAIDTDISLEEGAALTSTQNVADLGIGDFVSSTGSSVAVLSTQDIDAITPFTLNIVIPASQGLALDGDARYLAILYKVRIAAENRTVIGIMPTTELVITDNTVKFSTKYFGIYQPVFLKTEVTEAKQVASNTPILSQTDVAAHVAALAPHITINRGAAYTNSKDVTISMSSSGATQMYVTNDAGCSTGGTWETYATNKSWILGQANATATVYAKFMDDANVESSCVSDAITYSTQTTNYVLINGGVGTTTSSSVTLTISANGATQMYITNTDGCVSGGSWEPLANTKVWTLNQTNSLAIVYAKFRDEANNEAPCITGIIVHDNIPPTNVSVLINEGASYTT